MVSTAPVGGWVASARYGDSIAPGGLAFVEDLLNTASAGRPRLPDLLADRDDAQQWLDGALRALRTVGDDSLGDGVTLSARDVRDLRLLRDDLRAGLFSGGRGPDDDGDAGQESVARGVAGLVLDQRGRVQVRAQGQGADLIRSYVLLQLAVAEVQGQRGRLKVCANEACQSAFFDLSKNSSRIWHDVKTCGNAANLRAYRRRLKEGASAGVAR
ncbi:CGNR zinc finger domain-containing protein [Kineococcus aurantiacus]|uniref:Putative RNA-binding Zn ribbon-like protein n=1 Tax=Kineococcus aurantiacus TaxID=37633 RepID=A0A7Y9DHL6_9ACTN|nr:CGNR zinc finger domain-containing protein [Kineococcus aurantiacus]NYD20500.1 putative RNA-binding Zn ribbon-like protein [Kineococcus aurantiacus]